MKYKCKENDAIIEIGKDKSEILISINGDNECGKTVIGLKDLKNALTLFDVGFQIYGICPICKDEGFIMCSEEKTLCPDCGCKFA